jgi:predicted nucleotidyltransferase
MMTKEDILALLKDELPNLRNEYGVDTLAIFGSYAKGEQMEGSDIDMLVEFSEPVSLFDLIGLENQLTDLLGVKVDLGTFESIKPMLKDEILNSAVYV